MEERKATQDADAREGSQGQMTRWAKVKGLLVRLGVTGSALALFVWLFQAKLFQAWGVLWGISWGVLLAAVSLSFLGVFFYAFRWRLLQVALGAQRPFSFWEAVRVKLSGTFFGLFLPTAFGTDAAQGFLSQDCFDKPVRAYAVVLLNRFFGVVGLVLAAVLAFVFASQVPWRLRLGAGVLGLVGVGVFFLGLSALRELPSRLQGGWGERLAPLGELPGHKVTLWALLLSVGSQLGFNIPTAVLVLSVAPEADGALSVSWAILSQFAGFLPSFLGLGFHQVALTVLLEASKVSSAAAIAIPLALWGISVCQAVLGALWYALVPDRAKLAMKKKRES